MAVALTHRVYLWTEQNGVKYPPLAPVRAVDYVSALAFSSYVGGKAILAVARSSGHVTLWSLFEQKARFEFSLPWAACSVAWRPILSQRRVPEQPGLVWCEDLLVGDDCGCLYYYAIYWPDFGAGYMTLITKLDAHSQNICGLAWSPDGKTFVSGGNDNTALLFMTDEVDSELEENPIMDNNVHHEEANSRELDVLDSGYLTPPQSPQRRISSGSTPYIVGQHSRLEIFGMSDPTITALDILTPPDSTQRDEDRGRPTERLLRNFRTTDSSFSPAAKSRIPHNLDNRLANPGIPGRSMLHRKAFYHSAAVKAIAYAPWQPTLLATSGGSNDRQIHFHHTESGSTLAVINVFAQVTSLSWSHTRREIVATFGYAQPEHDVRIAVFAWPSCDCVVSIPWDRKANGEIGRALWAIPYPGGPNDAVPEVKEDEEDEDGVGFQA